MVGFKKESCARCCPQHVGLSNSCGAVAGCTSDNIRSGQPQTISRGLHQTLKGRHYSLAIDAQGGQMSPWILEAEALCEASPGYKDVRFWFM